MGTFNQDTFNRIKDTLAETAQDVKDRAIQVRDAVVETAKDTRDRAMGMAEEMLVTGARLKEKLVGEMDVLQVLKKDHEMVSSLFEQIEACDDNAEDVKEGFFAQLRYELSTHAMVEEEIFYPALERGGGKDQDGQQAQGDEDEREDLIHEAYQEHNVVKQLLAELTSLPLSAPEWKAKLTVLKENVEHHVEEEENELFVIARQVMDKDQLREMGVRLQQEKVALAEAGKPDESDEPLVQRDEAAAPAGPKSSARKRGSPGRGRNAAGGRSHRTH